jgi:general secretion pathway protein C
MNKRLPLLLSLLAVILLAASLAYWILQLYQPPQRPLAAAPVATMPDPSVESAATLFGGQPAAATVTNYQLTGVISAGRDSVAIIVADGAPAKALRIGRELSPGVTVAEVYPRYIMLSDSGVMKRIDLAPDSKAAAPMGGPSTVPQGNIMSRPAQGMQQGMLQGGPAGMQPGAVTTPITPAGTPPPAPPEQSPLAPGAVVQQPQSEPPPANPNSAPAQAPAPGQQPNNAPQEPTTNTQ